MKHNEIILRNQAHPRLTANTTTSSNNGTAILYVDTGPGYIELGPANSSHCHILTDRSNFYFNKQLMVNSGVVGSYDEDLYLRRAGNSNHEIQVSTTTVSTPLNLSIGGNTATFANFVHIGDSSSYNSNSGSWGARLNVTDNVHSKIEVGQDANSMLSHWYAHTGHTGIKFGTASNHDVEFQRNGSTHLEIESGGLMTMVPIRRNSHHASGFLEGSYNSVGANGYKSNPIYTIGSSYNPADASLSNMYGIGFCRANQATFISIGGASNWGMYVAADGDARIFLDGGNGHVSSKGSHYARAGAAASPSFAFENDTDTGMYRYTTNQIGFATAGTHRMSIDNTGLRLSTGYYIAQNSTESTILKSATSTNYLQIRNSSNTLHGGVYGSGSEIGFLDRDSNWAIRHAADSHTYFYINNSERVHIDNDGLDIVQGSLMMSGQHAIREKYYSGIGNIGASGSWYTLCYITENATPAYITLKYSAHSTQTFVVSTGYHGSNVASIQMLSGTWTQNGGYPGASEVRILKDSNSNYRFQLKLTYSNSSPTAFALYARAWGGTPVNDIVNFESSLTVDTTTGTTIDSMNTNYSGSGSSRAHRAANGSAGLPAYTFHQDSDTGMYLNGTGNIGFASAGTTRAQISGSKLTVLGGTGIDLQTSSGNVRGLLVSSESAPHLRIATSGNEQIGFYDGGTSGTLNVLIEGAGHVDLKTGNFNMGGTTVIDTSRHATFPRVNVGSTSTYLAQNSNTSLNLTTSHGYLDFGPMNSGYCHFQTDRSKFYFNKRLIVDEGIVSSYDENLHLQRASTTKITIHNDKTESHNTLFQIGGSEGGNAYNTTSSTRLMFGGGNSDAQSNYYIGTNMENYGGNYTKLDLRWHTGIRMGAQQQYGGIRFYNNEDLGAVLLSIGKGDTKTRVEAGELRLENGVHLNNVDGYVQLKRTANAPLIVDRLGTTGSSGTARGDQINFKSAGNKNGAIGYQTPYGGIGYRYSGDWGLGYYSFANARYVQPCNASGGIRDNEVDLGSSSSRFDDVYATNGSIQTSDRNEKQDIQALTTAEQAAAVACKALVRRFRWIDSVEEKGDNARYHFGVIAQDVEAAFTAQGLDAGRYGLFIRTNWWEHNNTWYPDEESAPEGAVERNRLGIRYNQLLAFIISAL